ncbi:MAG TPA: Holliday junction resolvase [Thermoplasmatales archaeon]|nr:Holliday junction resolvase [Candidatus Thermoplasmatota archaeon]MDD5778433.1 Holliday junction resolvase [Candidatus Thermoplasmatota archaeon]HDS59301.1 Holliday junction resolvase [Thermoplasmatales archaeon]
MSSYERELREILSGNQVVIDRVTKTCSPTEQAQYRKIIRNPFIVVRAAGSLGIADIVALRGGMSFLVEIKARAGSRILFSHEGGRMQRQAEEMLASCQRCRVLPLFAFRIKGVRGDSWRVYSLPMDGLEGRAQVLHRRLPHLETTGSGNFVMDWNAGMKLSDFIDYVTSLVG